MISVPLAPVWVEHAVGRRSFDQRTEVGVRGRFHVAQVPVRVTEEGDAGETEDPGRGLGFPLPCDSGVIGRELRESELTRGEERDIDSIARGDVQSDRSTAPDRFVVGMRRDDQDVHARSDEMRS